MGKKQTCPYCKEKVDLKRMFSNPYPVFILFVCFCVVLSDLHILTFNNKSSAPYFLEPGIRIVRFHIGTSHTLHSWVVSRV